MSNKLQVLLNALYHGLIGFNLGLAMALLLAQWTWLELRVNTGLMLIVGCAAGLVFGLKCSGRRRPLFWGGLSVITVMIVSLAIAKGNLEAMQILLGAMFREGTLMPDLPLSAASGITGILIVLTLVVAWIRYRAVSCIE